MSFFGCVQRADGLYLTGQRTPRSREKTFAPVPSIRWAMTDDFSGQQNLCRVLAAKHAAKPMFMRFLALPVQILFITGHYA